MTTHLSRALTRLAAEPEIADDVRGRPLAPQSRCPHCLVLAPESGFSKQTCPECGGELEPNVGDDLSIAAQQLSPGTGQSIGTIADEFLTVANDVKGRLPRVLDAVGRMADDWEPSNFTPGAGGYSRTYGDQPSVHQQIDSFLMDLESLQRTGKLLLQHLTERTVPVQPKQTPV